ncbi:hypothetical protein L7F22_045609 [Adiantum nelumboides]|nr:hypothetical protein [Adiantum nelumboides]
MFPASQGSGNASPEPRVKEFKIYRWNPDKPQQPYMQSFLINLADCGPMVLDALQKIKAEQDSSLTFRRSCREGVCGSCSMNINGTNTMACLCMIDPDVKEPQIITPLPHLHVVKDLVVDLTNLYQQYRAMAQTKETRTQQERYPQTPQQRAKLNGYYECILCFCCSSACPSYWWNGDRFLGPVALIQIGRWIQDRYSVDDVRVPRLDELINKEELHIEVNQEAKMVVDVGIPMQLKEIKPIVVESLHERVAECNQVVDTKDLKAGEESEQSHEAGQAFGEQQADKGANVKLVYGADDDEDTSSSYWEQGG